MKTNEIQVVREFNRFYSNLVGLLDHHILDSPYSLAEARILYELHHRQPCSAKLLSEVIQIDKGYLSRVLTAFERKGLLVRQPDDADGRALRLSLTAKGDREFAHLDGASKQQITELLAGLTDDEVQEAIAHMQGLKALLAKRTPV